MHQVQLGLPSSASSSVAAESQASKSGQRRTRKTCGECRRLKLKCDRVFPCQSCIKRGCEGICPEGGSLVSGRGSRYILANTERLHEKITRMAKRIRDLEDALRVVSEEHARCSNLELPSTGPAHPLLREDLLLVKNLLELYGPNSSHLAAKSDASRVSESSDVELSMLGNEQSLLPSPLEALIFDPAAQLLESQLVQYGAGDNIHSEPQLTSDVLLARSPWPTNSQTSNSYQTDMKGINGTPSIQHPSTMSIEDYQPRHRQNSGTSFSLQDLMDTSIAYCSDTASYLPSNALYHQNEEGTANLMNSIWDLEGRSM